MPSHVLAPTFVDHPRHPHAATRECTLVLLRHGESVWNREGRFTGWCDVALTEEGEEEAVDAGKVLANVRRWNKKRRACATMQ